MQNKILYYEVNLPLHIWGRIGILVDGQAGLCFFTFTTIGLGGYPYYTLLHHCKYYTTHGKFSAAQPDQPDQPNPPSQNPTVHYTLYCC